MQFLFVYYKIEYSLYEENIFPLFHPHEMMPFMMIKKQDSLKYYDSSQKFSNDILKLKLKRYGGGKIYSFITAGQKKKNTLSICSICAVC